MGGGGLVLFFLPSIRISIKVKVIIQAYRERGMNIADAVSRRLQWW